MAIQGIDSQSSAHSHAAVAHGHSQVLRDQPQTSVMNRYLLFMPFLLGLLARPFAAKSRKRHTNVQD